MSFQAIVAPEPGPAALCELTDAELPDGDVTVAVSHSSLNYKDGLVVTGTGRVARSYPMVCGIDLAGVVESSDSPQWQIGDRGPGDRLGPLGEPPRRLHRTPARSLGVVDAPAGRASRRCSAWRSGPRG